MKFFWGKKKKADEAAPIGGDGDPEVPAPEPEPEPAPAPPETPPGPSEPEEPAPSPDPVYPPDEPPFEIPPSGPDQLEMKRGFFSRLADGLKKSSSRLSDSVSAVFTKRKLDEAALEELEDLLLTSDLGAGPASRVIARLSKDKFDKEVTDAEVRGALADVVSETLAPHERDFDLSGPAPQVVLFVGVNGSGKTTTLGKIAAMIAREGRKVVLAAGDTFRAAAIEQVKVWGERAGAPVVAREIGADAAGLVFDAYDKAKADGADVLLVDTAGRLQNKQGLMEELAKIVRVLKKQDESAPHHVLLVLDATVGQNALSQAQAFKDIAGVTGLVMTKLDGTAKGGVLVALADAHPELPIYFTGIGEGVDDLRPFSAADFAAALAGEPSEAEAA
ncbi:MAG: signal recognition particle-docking protein FtsY [Maricaulaceae bacterium]